MKQPAAFPKGRITAAATTSWRFVRGKCHQVFMQCIVDVFFRFFFLVFFSSSFLFFFLFQAEHEPGN